MNRYYKVIKCCGTCDMLYMGSNEPVDDDMVCYCGIDNRYLCYPDERMCEKSCDQWIPDDETKEIMKNMNEVIEKICAYAKTLSSDNEDVISECIHLLEHHFEPKEPLLTEGMEGHTKHLQGLDLPMYVNSIYQSNGVVIPSDISEMHIGELNGGEKALFITPSIVATPEEEIVETKESINDMIRNAIHRELIADTESLTSDGFSFIENEAQREIANKLLNDVLSDETEVSKHLDSMMYLMNHFSISCEEINQLDVDAYLQDVISEYVSKHGVIRIHNKTWCYSDS